MMKLMTYVLAVLLASSVGTAQTEVLTDGGFEAGTPNSAWDESSTNFVTPLCDQSCNPNYVANTGSWYGWFGGIDTATEIGILSQDFTIPASASSVDLLFWLHIPAASSNTDSFKVLVDNNDEFLALSEDTTSYSVEFTEIVLSLDNYADGGNHTLMFWGYHLANVQGNITNFLLDDVSLLYSTGTGVIHDLLSDGITIMPNPTSDELRVVVSMAREEGLDVELLNVSGQQVSSHSVPPGATGTLHIPVDDLANGSYTLRISDHESTITRNVMVQH